MHLTFCIFLCYVFFVLKILNLVNKMPSNFSIQSILGNKEPEVVVLSSDSETEDNEADVNKPEMTPLETKNDNIQMVEVGLDCFLKFNTTFTLFAFASVHISLYSCFIFSIFSHTVFSCYIFSLTYTFMKFQNFSKLL